MPAGADCLEREVWVLRLFGGTWADSDLCLPARLGRKCFWGSQHTINSSPSLRGTFWPGDPSGLTVSAVSSASQEELGEK